MPLLHTDTPVRLGLMSEVIKSSEPFDNTAHVNTILNEKMYAHTFKNFSVQSYHLEFNVSSSSAGGVA